jgi:hypothetical protein
MPTRQGWSRRGRVAETASVVGWLEAVGQLDGEAGKSRIGDVDGVGGGQWMGWSGCGESV